MGAQLHAEVTKQALRDHVGIDSLDATRLPAAPADVDQFLGTYRFAGPDEGEAEETDVRATGDALTVSTVGAAAFYAPDRIVALDGLWRHERGQFLRGPDGKISSLRMGGRLGQRVA